MIKKWNSFLHLQKQVFTLWDSDILFLLSFQKVTELVYVYDFITWNNFFEFKNLIRFQFLPLTLACSKLGYTFKKKEPLQDRAIFHWRFRTFYVFSLGKIANETLKKFGNSSQKNQLQSTVSDMSVSVL